MTEQRMLERPAPRRKFLAALAAAAGATVVGIVVPRRRMEAAEAPSGTWEKIPELPYIQHFLKYFLLRNYI